MTSRATRTVASLAEPISLQEAASRLGVHYMTAYRYVRTGRLPAQRDGVQALRARPGLGAPAAGGRARVVQQQQPALGRQRVAERALPAGEDRRRAIERIVGARSGERVDGSAAETARDGEGRKQEGDCDHNRPVK